MTALAIGAGFGSGVYFFGRAVVARQWHSIGPGLAPVWLFTLIAAASTALHWDRFNHANPAFWVWVGVYTVTPVLLPIVWWMNRNADPRQPGSGELAMPVGVRLAMAGVGVLGLAAAAVMFIWPEVAAAVWPWALTPLSARVESAWVALAGAVGVAAAREARWSAVAPTLHTGTVAAWLTLIGIARAWADFDPHSVATYAYLLYIGGAAVGLPLLALSMRFRGPRIRPTLRVIEGGRPALRVLRSVETHGAAGEGAQP
jgi:hypothetical protein